MARPAVQENRRIAMRIRAGDKAMIIRAAALEQTNLTEFMLRTALREAQAVIDNNQQVKLTRRDSLAVLDLLENPPCPNSKLRKVARGLPAIDRSPIHDLRDGVINYVNE